jgi:hypothetical protein
MFEKAPVAPDAVDKAGEKTSVRARNYDKIVNQLHAHIDAVELISA